jgi:uncharacterized repeat protein (TIGR02059 family)
MTQSTISQETVNGINVTTRNDNYGTWVLVMNYEHYGGTNPSVSPGSTFPKLPNNETTASDVDTWGSNGELTHVDNISQYGVNWQADAVRLEATTANHDRKINFFTTNQSVVDAIIGETTTNYTDFQDGVTNYTDHNASLPFSANDEAIPNPSRIFGSEFPFYKNVGSFDENRHWALSAGGDRWEVDDYPKDTRSSEGDLFSTVHRVWVRVPQSIFDESETTAPTFKNGATTSVSVAEATTGIVIDVDADDDDGADYDMNVDYSLGSAVGDDTDFSIDTATGQLSLDSALDFESPTDDNGDSTYNLTVTATDDADNSNQQSITVSITDVNEAPAQPTDSDDGPNEVAEEATNGTEVGIDADTTDPEGDSLTWSLTDDAAGRFEVDSNGVVTVADTSTLDFESSASHNITVQVSDGSLSATEDFTISVTDSDETPTFTNSGPASVSESSSAGVTVHDVDATVGGSADEGVSYAITAGSDDVSGDGNDAFAINASTGQITVNDADDVDRSAQSSFTLTVEASEGSQSATQNVTLTVVDDVGPTVTSSDPADGSTGHLPGANLTITFSEAVDFGSGQITVRKVDTSSIAETFDVTTDTGSGDGTVSITGSRLTINPTDLDADTEYAVRIDATAITDTATTPNAFAGIGTDDDLNFSTADTQPRFAQATGGTISVSVDEDDTLNLTKALEVNDISANDTLTWSLANGPADVSNGTVSNVDGEVVSYSSGTSHTLPSGPEYVPNADFAGSGSVDEAFDVQVIDGDDYTATATVEVDVQQVNDAPSVTLGSNRTVNGTTSQQTAGNFATFSPGGGSDEAGQSADDYTVTVVNDSNGVLSAVDIDTDGTLNYTANASVEGTASVEVVVQDDGGTANGGSDSSTAKRFAITVDTRSPTVDSASTTAQTLTVQMDEPLSTAAANTPPGENFTVTAGGSRAGVTEVTIDGSTISLRLSNRISFGETVTLNYTRGTNITEDLATNQLANFTAQPVTNTVSRPNRGGSGGGGSDRNSDGEESTVTVEPEPDSESGAKPSSDNDSTTDDSDAEAGTNSKSVSVRDARGGERVRIDLSPASTEEGDESTDDTGDGDGSNDTGDEGSTNASSQRPGNVVADGLDIQFVEDGDYNLTVRTRDADTSDNAELGSSGDSDSTSSSRPDLSTNSLDDEGIRFARETRQRPVGFIEVDTEFEEDAVETATHRFRVRKSYLESTGASVESVRLYRDEITQWRELETRQVDETQEYYFFEADTPGFSVFVIGTSAPVFETTAQRLVGFNETTGVVEAGLSVENIGSEAGIFDAVLTADGVSIGTVEISVPAGERVESTVTGVVEGTEPVGLTLAGQSLGDVTPTKPDTESSGVGIFGLLVGVAVVVVGVLLWRRGSTDDGDL